MIFIWIGRFCLHLRHVSEMAMYTMTDEKEKRTRRILIDSSPCHQLIREDDLVHLFKKRKTKSIIRDLFKDPRPSCYS